MTDTFTFESGRVYHLDVLPVPEISSNYAGHVAIPEQKSHQDAAYAAGLCINNTTNEVIADVNPYETVYPASITKIMTALLVLEHGNLSDTVTIQTPILLYDPQAVAIGLQVGDTITVEELMYGMLVTSANDCAVALGRYVAGDDESFAELMNTRAAELGATHTHFVNPNGLHSPSHYTTAYDLYLIFKELIRHEEFRSISGQAEHTFQYTTAEGISVGIPIGNSNLFVSQTYAAPDGLTVVCGKTGTTNEAGYCLIVDAEDTEGQEYIAVICHAGSRAGLYTEMQNLLHEIPAADPEK